MHMENKIEFQKITSIPTAKDLGSLFKEARILAGFSHKNAGELAASFDRRYSFGSSNYQKWEDGSRPGVNFKKALLGLFRGICDQSVYHEWESAYHRLEAELIKNRADKECRSKLEESASISGKLFVDTSEKESEEKDKTFSKKEVIYKKSFKSIIFFKKYWFFFFIGFLSIGYLLYSNVEEENPFSESGLISESKNLKVDHDEANGQNDEKETALKNGLLADVYVWREKYKVPPSKPEGDIVSSYIYEGDSNFYYYNDYLSTSTLQAMADKGTGSHFYGFLEVKEEGKHLFEIRFHSVQHTVNQFWSRDCYVSISINDEKVFNSFFKVGQDNYKSVISESFLNEGLNKFDLWYSCENLLGFNAHQDYEVYRDTYVKIYMKSLKDSELSVVRSNFMKHIKRYKKI